MYEWRGIPLVPVFSPPSPCWVTGRSATLIWELRAADGERRQGNALWLHSQIYGSIMADILKEGSPFPTERVKNSCIGDLTECFSCKGGSTHVGDTYQGALSLWMEEWNSGLLT